MGEFNVSRRSISDLIRTLNDRAPLGAAEEWDNVGLLVGDPSWETTGAVVSIDLTAEAIELAIQKNYKLIVNHHPCIFPKNRGLSRVTPKTLVFDALRAGVAVASYHTNFDQCALEVVDFVSRGLQLQPKGRLIDKPSHALKKLTTFVPISHIEAVRTALCEAGAGHVGNYDSCTFNGHGEGTFRGGKDSKPFLGKPEQLEIAEEIRLETVFPKGIQDLILRALFKSHPYEEVAYDLHPVDQPASGKGLVRGLGYGFWGEFPSPRPFSDVAKDVKSLFNIHGFWITNPIPSHVTRVGFVAGKGSSFVEAASSLGCDLFITGEAGYHTALGGLHRGVAVMELGHRESERFFIETMKTWLTSSSIEVIEVQTPIQKIWSGGTK